MRREGRPASLRALELPALRPIPRQQAVSRDIALLVHDRVTHDALVAVLADDPLIHHVTLFDVYQPGKASAGIGDGERSLALRLELLDPAATLTDERIDAVVAAAVARAGQALGARLRGAETTA